MRPLKKNERKKEAGIMADRNPFITPASLVALAPVVSQ